MSNIDQAFINAYSDQPAAPAARPGVTFAARNRAPALRVFGHTAGQETESRVDYPEPMLASRRPPHFAPNPYAPSAVAIHPQTAVETAEPTLPSLMGERRPLSAFAAPRETPNAAFRPVFEVDEFQWPAITDDLLRSSRNLLLPIVESLFAAAREGRSLVGIAGTTAGVGTSTVGLCLARLIAEAGLTIALVDGDFARGNLASTLGLEFSTGWEDVLAGQIPLAECAVHSLADKITLVPLGSHRETVSDRLSSIQSSVIAGMLRYHHDLVLFDLGAATEAMQRNAAQSVVEHCRVDVGIIVAPAKAKDMATLHGIDQLSALFGPHCLGVIGNRAK